MYILDRTIKNDPMRRWALPDRIFFGRGACHILAGVYLQRPPLPDFFAERIIPADGFSGNHIYVTNGDTAFDYHGYCCRDHLLANHFRSWQRHQPGWHAEVECVQFNLLDTQELNARKMLGPDQYLGDPISRAQRFIARANHAMAAAAH